MKIYLAARYGRRLEIQQYANELLARGHQVIARWLDGLHEAADGDRRRWAQFAQDDLDDIRRCDTVVSFTESGLHPRGSRHVEFGIALAMEKMLVVIGPVENVFHALPRVLVFPTFADFLSVV